MILGYTRCSTIEQAREGNATMPAQERVIRGVAMTHGCAGFDVSIFSDPGISGTMPLQERPAGKELLAAVKKNDIVIASKLDRMFRSASDALVTAEQFKKRGIDLILFDLGADPVTSNGMAKFFFTMVSAFAELERVKIADRMREGRDGKKNRQGHIGGAAPYGWDVIGSGREARLVPNQEEQDVIALARQIRETHGFRKPYRVTRALNEMGVTTRLGKPWHRVQVMRFLDRAVG